MTPVHHDHILQLRARLEEALSALHLPTGGYAHSTINNGDPIYAIDFQELRDKIKAAWNALGLGLTQYYDGDRLRVKKSEYGVATYYVRSSVLGGQVVAELEASGNWTRGYVYLGGQMLAIQGGSGGQVSWVHQDPVTKSQRITNSSGAVTSTIDLDPWGGETARSSNQAFQPHRYTSYERDANGGDDAMMRRYQSSLSRFSQPDPYDGSYSLTNPQSFNRYSYVGNDPVNFVDPIGLNMAPTTLVCHPVIECRNGECWDTGYQRCYISGGGASGEGGGGGGGGQTPPSTKPEQQPKPDCKQDKTGGDRGDIEDLLGRAGLSDSISNIQSAGPKNPEGIIFEISNRQAFLAILDADPRFRGPTPFGGEHASQVGASKVSVLDYRSFTTDRDTLGIDSHGFRRSLQVDVGPGEILDPTNPQRALGYADLDCDNPGQDVVGGLKHGVPIIFRRLRGLFRR